MVVGAGGAGMVMGGRGEEGVDGGEGDVLRLLLMAVLVLKLGLELELELLEEAFRFGKETSSKALLS